MYNKSGGPEKESFKAINRAPFVSKWVWLAWAVHDFDYIGFHAVSVLFQEPSCLVGNLHTESGLFAI